MRISNILNIAAFGLGCMTVGLAAGTIGHETCRNCSLRDKLYEELVVGADTDGDDIFNSIGTVDRDLIGKVEPMKLEEFSKEYKTYLDAVSNYDFSGEEPVRTDHHGDPIDEEEERQYTGGVGETYVISYNEWCENDDDEYEKDTLIYYREDGVVCDMRDDTIREYEDIVGENALNFFGCMSHDEDVVYIRNERRMTDYEFIREHTSYRKSVLGLSPEAEELADEKIAEALEFAMGNPPGEIDTAALADYVRDKEREDE